MRFDDGGFVGAAVGVAAGGFLFGIRVADEDVEAGQPFIELEGRMRAVSADAGRRSAIESGISAKTTGANDSSSSRSPGSASRASMS
jgi:hypothetical protein